MAKKTGKSQKFGRNADWCKAYRSRNQREKNKAKRLIRHLARFPSDPCAVHCYNNLPAVAKTLPNFAVQAKKAAPKP